MVVIKILFQQEALFHVHTTRQPDVATHTDSFLACMCVCVDKSKMAHSRPASDSGEAAQQMPSHVQKRVVF